MKTKLTIIPAILFFALLVSFSPIKLFSQTVTISGASAVNVDALETYTANFSYSPDPLSIISWSVTGGTIVNQNVYINNGTIYCQVQWNSTPCAGTITIYEDLNNGNGEKAVDVGNYSTHWNITGEINNTTTINCTPLTNNNCNYIQNHNLIPTTPPYNDNNWNPFVEGLVPYWAATHGTPHLFDGFDLSVQPPPPATRFAYMWSKSPSSPSGPSTGEGIAQKIKPLTANTSYNLSFYLRYSLYLTDPAASLDHFYVYLIHCNDYNSFPLSTFDIPTIPSGAQLIYDGTYINNISWEQRQISFTANDSYDMIWFFPKQGNAGAGHTAGFNFAYPQLSNSANSVTITPTGPIDYYTPVDYGCPRNMTFTSSSVTGNQWFKNGQPLQGETGQTLQLGYISGQCVTVSGSYHTEINGCPSNSVALTIKYYGYGWYGEEPFNFGATYHPANSPSFYCINSTGKIKNVDLGSSTTYTWSFINATNPSNQANILLNTATYNPTLPVADVLIGGDPYSGVFVRGVADKNGKQAIIDYLIYQSPYINPVHGNNYTICAGHTANIYMLSNPGYSGFYDPWWNIKPGGSNFDWEEYEFGPNTTRLNYAGYVVSTSPLIIKVPGGNQQSEPIKVQFSGPSYVHKKFYHNNSIDGCAEENFNVVASFPGCLRMNLDLSETDERKASSIFPNPTTSQATIKSDEPISEIEIFDINRTISYMRTKYTGPKTVTIDVSYLKPGIYICKIATQSKTEFLKIRVVR